MKAMILAAGLGTRLKPWTLEHPKALVPVFDVPMLERVIRKLESEGFDQIVVNVHHFGNQIIDFLNSRVWKATIYISDERAELLDTGGGIKHAERLLVSDSEPFLVHNVDILSSAPLAELMRRHTAQKNKVSLIVSNRNSSRKLIFDNHNILIGWHNLSSGEMKRAANVGDGEWAEILKCAETNEVSALREFYECAFSGIHIMNPDAVFNEMKRLGLPEKFPIMDFFLNQQLQIQCKALYCEGLKLIDIGKPETLAKANSMAELL